MVQLGSEDSSSVIVVFVSTSHQRSPLTQIDG